MSSLWLMLLFLAAAAPCIRADYLEIVKGNITIPASMFAALKDENQQYYGVLKNQHANTPLRYPTWDMLHSFLFSETAGSGQRIRTIYTEFTASHHHIPKSEGYMSGVNDDAFSWIHRELGRDIRFFVEVGSFIGYSAAVWGKNLKAQKSPGVLLCVDTWAGDGNMWTDPSLVPIMRIRGGQPHIYEQFMQLMIDSNLTDTVIPWRVASPVAARYLRLMKYHIDVLYLDSAHELGETFMEILMWWQNLQPSSLLVGDDWLWTAVSHDVKLFVSLHPDLKLIIANGRWMIRGPGAYVRPSNA